MRAFALRIQQVIGTALILLFFSEFFFLNETPMAAFLATIYNSPLELLAQITELTLLYALFAYPMLICISYFRLHTWSGLFLAAGIYGIGAESLVVPYIYLGLPVSILWTSLSWHILIDVLFGWLALRYALRAKTIWPGSAVLVLAGIFWGIWATWFWGGDFAPFSRVEFATITAFSTLVLFLGLFFADQTPLTDFTPPGIETLIVAILWGGLFAAVGFAYLPQAIAIFALVVSLILTLAYGSRNHKTKSIQMLERPQNRRRYLILPVLPIVATLTYSVVLSTGFPNISEGIILVIISVGIGGFSAAFLKVIWEGLHK